MFFPLSSIVGMNVNLPVVIFPSDDIFSFVPLRGRCPIVHVIFAGGLEPAARHTSSTGFWADSARFFSSIWTSSGGTAINEKHGFIHIIYFLYNDLYFSHEIMYLGVNALENERKFIEVYLRCSKRFNNNLREGYNNRQITFKTLYRYTVFSRTTKTNFNTIYFNSFCSTYIFILIGRQKIKIKMRETVLKKTFILFANCLNDYFRFLV